MKSTLLLLVATLFFFSSCKKEETNTPTPSPENYWRVNGKIYPVDTADYYMYKHFPGVSYVDTNVQYVDMLSKAGGKDYFLRFLLKKSVSLAQNTSLSLDTQMQIALESPITPNRDSVYGRFESRHLTATVRVNGGKASISVPETWLYIYRYNGSIYVPVDSALFSCNIQVPSVPTIIYGKDNYWKLNDTVVTFNSTDGVGTPSATNPYTFYSINGRNGNAIRLLDIRFVDPRTPGSNTPASVRVGKLFKIQFYASNSSAPSDTTYSTADTSEVYATIGGQGSSFTLAMPEMWVYRWKRDSQGNLVRDSVRFSCDIQG